MSDKIKNISEAAQKIKDAVNNKERIILYGDSDLDGIASVVILEETIKSLGGSISAIIFPDGENDGYGINMRALEFLKGYAPRSGAPVSQEALATRALLITLDLGISNVKEVEVANGMGFEVIIIDHHKVLDELPKAKIIVNPHQKDDIFPFKDLCTAGIVFKLCSEILLEMSGALKNSFLELVALATIADMVPQTGENKTFIEEGLRSLGNTVRPGLKAFLDILGEGEVASGGHTKIISALNAAETTDFNNVSHKLLTSSSIQEARQIAQELLGKASQKQQKIKEITQEVERRIAANPEQEIIFEGDRAWKLVLAGPVASIIAAKYGKPTFIYKKGDEISVGSVRSLIEGQDSVEAMKSCADLLISYGGHPKASGFRIKTENLEKFKNCLINYFQSNSNK